MGCHQMNCWKNGFELDLAASVAWHWPKRSLNRKFNISDHWRFPWLPTSARPRMTSMTRRHLVCPRALIKRGTWRASNHDGGNESLGSENADADHLSLRNSKRAEHLDGLPLSLKGGMTVENWGCLYEGPDEGKYWSSSRRKYPYPVGYTVTKSYNSQLFTQMIKKGDMGPLFMIMVGKDAFSAHTPGKAWASALSALASNSNEIEIKNIHGARYFGFENPLVLQKLEEMVKQHRSRTTRDTIAEEETSKRTRSSKGSSKIVNAAGSSTQGDDKGKQNESGSSGEELHNQNFVGSQSSRKEKHLLQDSLLSIKKIRLRSEPVNQSQGSTIQRKELLGQDNIQEMPLDTQDMHASDLTVQNCNVVTSNTMESPSEEDFRTMTELVVLEDGAEDGPDMPECADDLVLQETEETFTPDKVQMQESMGDKQSGSALNLLLGKAGSGSKINISDYEVFFPFMFDFWQRQVIQKIHEEKSVLVCAPDGAGKSAVAEFCLLEALVKNRRAIFVTPYQIQAKQHFQKFQKMFGGKNISGDWQSHMAQRNAMVLVVTLTSLVKLLRERSPVIEDRAFVVMDKFHTISDPAHGSYWEEVLMLLSPEISLLALSILVDNARYIVSWMDSIYKCCELVTSRTETLPKKYLIYDDSRPGVYQFVNPDKMEVDPISREVRNVDADELGMEQSGSNTYSSLNNTEAWRFVLSHLQQNNMLPSVLILSNVNDHVAALEYSCKAFSKGLLSRVDVMDVKCRLREFANNKPRFLQLVGEEDQRGLELGIANYHNGQLPIWREFIVELINNKLVKLVLASKTLILQTEIRVRTIVLCAPLKPCKLDLSLLTPSEFLQLRSIAGRRGLDNSGNIIFMQALWINHKQLSSLVFRNSICITSVFKPSYSLLLSLLANHGYSMSKIMLQRTFAEYAICNFQFQRMQKVEQLEQKIMDFHRKKLELEWTLFQNLSNANKRKLEDAAMYTRVHILLGSNDGLQTCNNLSGVLLAVVPGPYEFLYMVLSSDNIYRLIPAGALDHVYKAELPLDIAHKLATGEDLDLPCFPSKNSWQSAAGGNFGYFANGNATGANIVKVLQQHPIGSNSTKEGNDLRQQIQTITEDISCLKKKMDMLLLEEKQSGISGVVANPTRRTWKESERLISVLQEAGAIIRGGDGDSVQLKPFGKLILRLHYMENELWIATILTSAIWKHLTPPEFAGLCSTFLARVPIIESSIGKETERSYKYPKSIHEAVQNLRSLRKQVVSLQNCQNPPVYYDTSDIGLVHAWARAKPGTKEFKIKSIDDGAMAWKLRKAAQVAAEIYEACKKSVDDDNGFQDFLPLSRISRRAAHLLTRHNFVNGI